MRGLPPTIIAYASVVDNGTGDATTIPMRPEVSCKSPESGELVVESYDPEQAYDGVTLLAKIGVGEPSRILEVDMRGEIVRELELPPGLQDLTGGLEAHSLANGNVLVTVFNRGIYELTRSGQLVWSHETAKISHDGDRLANGNTIYVYGMGDQKSDAQVTEVDSSGSTAWQWFAADHYSDRFPNVKTEGWSHINAVQHVEYHSRLRRPRSEKTTLGVMHRRPQEKTGGKYWLTYTLNSTIALFDSLHYIYSERRGRLVAS